MTIYFETINKKRNCQFRKKTPKYDDVNKNTRAIMETVQ